MKKWISALLLMAVLVSLCAGGEKEPELDEPVATREPSSHEIMCGHIDQTREIDGVFQIWNAEGVKNMLENPGGNFELLCHVDMEGAVIGPVAEFTGVLTGQNWAIKNFTVRGGGETDFGFIGINKGQISGLRLENVTFLPGENAKNVGTLVGNNQGVVSDCTVTGAKLDVAAAPSGASVGSLVGRNTGSLTNTKVEAALGVTATGPANVGAIVGTAQGGEIRSIETEGKLEITGGGVSAGLFAGQASQVVFQDCKFLCQTNTLDGKLIGAFTGNQDEELVTCPNGLYRDNGWHQPLTEGQNQLRDLVVAEMNAMGTIQWRLHKDLVHTCTCGSSGCQGIYNAGTTYYGIPYNHKGGSLSRMQYALDEEGYVKDWLYGMDAYDGFDLYIGNDSATALAQAWWRVSNSTDFSSCTYLLPQLVAVPNVATGQETSGVLKVGDYHSDFTLNANNYTEQFMEVNGQQGMFRAYAALRKGDGYVYINPEGGHTGMAVEDAVVVLDQSGRINGDYSFVRTTEQGFTTDGDAQSTWRVNHKVTFADLFNEWAIPVTCQELATGQMEPSVCTMVDPVEGFAGMYNGTVKANYFLDSVDLQIQNAKGETVFCHTMWTTADKQADVGHNEGLLRNYKDDYDMVGFATPLSQFRFEKGQTYSYRVIAHLHTYEDYVVHESSFTYGQV